MCTIDGVLRRRAMNMIGRQLGLPKIATGHNLDDEAQTVLLHVLSNDLDRFA
jgi:Predicted ATPase of the PP-loop superfamily implicated in cell cycle control